MNAKEFEDLLISNCKPAKAVLISSEDYTDLYSDSQLKFIVDKCKLLGSPSYPHDDLITKKDIDSIIKHFNLHPKPEPVREIKNREKPQRIMDNLSRLLSVDARISPCVAVMLFNQQIVIASNASKNETIKKEELEFYLRKKNSDHPKLLRKII